MTRVLITQRVDVIESYGERRDCVDQRVAKMLYFVGYLPVFIPNQIEIAFNMYRQEKESGNLAGVVFTGGNSLEKYGGDAPERDEMERKLYDCLLKERIPVYGFCRGMQMILDYHGVSLEKVEGHVATYHHVRGSMCSGTRNSYHTLGCRSVPQGIDVLASAEDGVIEAIHVIDYPVYATMWHPERETPYLEEDTLFIHNLFTGGIR